jgi:hypothetical protein
MKCISVPLVKCKTGDLSDVNNYRAISVLTAISKLFEFVLAKFVESADAVDAYQFGFTAGHSTSLCTYVLKRTVDYYTDRGIVTFLRVFWTSVKLSTKSITGNCFISCLMIYVIRE